ncbi:hypothetical protein C0992_003343 [Termitomyces sp. T32_za158]|nr:hypothetical protein C0992_003343 [Termitomyces sp. T32_za158]
MPTVAEIQSLVKTLTALSSDLPLSIKQGSKSDKIWAVMNMGEDETLHETFNRLFDSMFGDDCRNSNGRLEHVCRGKLGLGLVCPYLSKIDWMANFPLDLVEIKLQRLVAELKYLHESDATRCTVPTAKLTDANNLEQPKLPFQRKAIDAYREQQAQDVTSQSHKEYTVSQSGTIDQDNSLKDNSNGNKSTSDTAETFSRKRPIVLDSDDESEGSNTPGEYLHFYWSIMALGTDFVITVKKTRVSLGSPTAMNKDGFLADITVQSIEEETAETHEEKRRDIDQFFHPPVTKKVNQKEKNHKPSIVNEVTTLRCHLEAHHSGKYRKWAEENKFESKLPGDIKKQKADAEHVMQTLDHNLKEKKIKERVIKYSHKEFRRAAIEWLVATDQAISALKHPKFKKMIDITSRATEEVMIPGQKSLRAAIKQSFQKHLKNLKAQLNSPKVPGKVNLTCDAWQAGNTDGYFAVTGHWIKEVGPMQWELKSALIGHITCDNASNNTMMLQEFAQIIRNELGKEFPWKEQKINCLAHVINLATQSLISTYSKTPHFDPKELEAHERSSSKRKEIWRTIQTKAGVTKPVQLILDMKVRWSSMFRMLDRVDKNKDHANNAQQAFLSDQVPTLHLAIPALEALHRAWSSHASRIKYTVFSTSLQAACQKIDDYYEKTTNSPAYIMAMILDPREKMAYFKKHWPNNLQVEVLRCVEDVFQERFFRFKDSEDLKKTQIPKSSTKGLNVLLRELSDDENEEDLSDDINSPPKDSSNLTEDPDQPWLRYFDEYINSEEKVADVEALQYLKCAIRHDLLFKEPGPSSLYEAELEKENYEEDGKPKEEGWDQLLSDDKDDNSFNMDIDLDSE